MTTKDPYGNGARKLEADRLEKLGERMVLTVSAETYLQSVGRGPDDFDYRSVEAYSRPFQQVGAVEHPFLSARAELSRIAEGLHARVVVDVRPDHRCGKAHSLEYLIGTALIAKK